MMISRNVGVDPYVASSANEKRRWTLPKRRRVSNESLHISDFVLVKKDSDSILFLRAGEKYPVSFKRGKLLLPAAILNYGENPREAAKRVLSEQLEHSEYLQPKFLAMQSYVGAHWDICLVFECQVENDKRELSFREPYAHASYHPLTSLPRREIAEDHLEVIDGLLQEKYDEQTVAV
jgi:hypothetical protein